MKKVIGFLLALALMVGMTACSSQPTDNSDTNTPTAPSASDATTVVEQDNTGTTTVAQSAGTTLQVPSKEVYFTRPEGWMSNKATYSTVLYETNESLVAVCYNFAVPYDGDLSGIVEFFGSGVMRDISAYSKGNMGVSSVTILSEDKVSVAGFDAVKFTGTAPNKDWNCHVYGYTLMVDGMPMMVMGLVSTQAQDPAMISAIDAMTDQVAASLRTTR